MLRSVLTRTRQRVSRVARTTVRSGRRMIGAEPKAAPAAHGGQSRVQTARKLIGEMSVFELAAVHVAVRDAELAADNHYFNPERPRRHLGKYATAAPDVFSGTALSGRSVLEFGSGTRNTRSVGALLMVNGAASVVCYEPGTVHARQATLAFEELLAAVVADPCRFTLPGGDPDRVAERAVTLLGGGGPEVCEGRDDLVALGRRFDVVMSNHVLEHVDDLTLELELLDDLTAADGVHVHRVDFRDHRMFAHRGARRTPVDFYVDGDTTTCNGLRACDVESAFELRGWDVARVAEERMPVADLPEPIIERFASYSAEELTTLTADWVAHPRRRTA